MDDYILSICIPTYNRSETVYSHVVELLNNHEKDIEIVVTDDCSDDNTEEVLSSISDKRLKYVRNRERLGYGNLARSLKNGSGKYCLLLADKDSVEYVDWNSVKNQLEENDDVSVFAFQYADENGHVLIFPPQIKMPSCCYNTYNKFFYSFRYSGGIVKKRCA